MVARTQIAEPVASSPNGKAPGEAEEAVPAPASETPAGVRNLYQRVTAVRVALGGTISRNGQAPQVMGGFRFVAWDEVAARVGTLMAENGIVLLPSMPACDVAQVGTTANGKPIYRATVSLVFELVNADDPSERTSMTWVGSGDDSGDKAIQKAATSGSKYLLLKLFMLGGADDPDAGGEEASADRPAASAAPRQRPAGGSKPRVVARTPTGRACPECGQGTLEHVRWDNGGEKIACSNWRDCRYREKVERAPEGERHD